MCVCGGGASPLPPVHPTPGSPSYLTVIIHLEVGGSRFLQCFPQCLHRAVNHPVESHFLPKEEKEEEKAWFSLHRLWALGHLLTDRFFSVLKGTV